MLKRGIILLVIALLTVSTLLGYIGDDPTFIQGVEESIFEDTEGFKYTYVLAVVGGSETSDTTCEDGNGAFGILPIAVKEGNILRGISYPQDVVSVDRSWYEDVGIGAITGIGTALGSIAGIAGGPAGIVAGGSAGASGSYYAADNWVFGEERKVVNCFWESLPLRNGCYFLSADRDTGENSDDCAGWFIPPSEPSDPRYISSELIRAAEYFLTGDEIITRSIESLLPGAQDLLLTGTYDRNAMSQPDGGNAACPFRAENIISPIQAFMCLQQDEEFRWYICDENSLYSETGDFIPIEESAQCDPLSEDPEGECATSNPALCSEPLEDGTTNPLCTCNEENKCVKDGEVIGAGEPKGWVCAVDRDTGAFTWRDKALDCDDLAHIGESCQTNEVVCEAEGFSYGEVEGENNCCGMQGIDDLGRRANAADGSGEYACLNKGSLKGDSTRYDTIWTANNCENEWCWVNAVGEADFDILTLEKPIENGAEEWSIQTYDLVSDNQEWVECNAERGEGHLDSSAVDPNHISDANRFTCVDAGNKWEWVDCVPRDIPVTQDNGIKKRAIADGLFALPIGGSSPTFFADLDAYSDYYGRFDIVGLTHLEFMVQFTEEPIKKPADIKVTIRGPADTIYLEQGALSFATNNPLLEIGHWIHVKMPLPEGDLLAVERILLEVKGDNVAEIKNLYFSRGSSALCSGELSPTPGENAWLETLDFYGNRNYNARNLCNELYSPRFDPTNPDTQIAWLGDDVLGDNKCCGNNENEYYAGTSESNYGCWNSVPIAPNGKTMNVVAEVGYKEPVIQIQPFDLLSVQYEVIPQYTYTHSFQFVVSGGGRISEDFVEEGVEYSTGETVLDPPPDPCPRVPDENIIDNDEGLPVLISPGETKIINIPLGGGVYGDVEVQVSCEPPGSPSNILENIFQLEKVALQPNPEMESVNIYFFNLRTGERSDEISPEDWERYGMGPFPDNYKILIEAEMVAPEVTRTTASASTTTTFTCDKQSCLFPLPGEPPYTITNPYPHLYNLYFVADENTKELIAGTSPFDPESGGGNLLAERVSQQVIYINEGEESIEETPTFYGCQAASFIENAEGLAPDDFDNLNYCSVKAAEYCAPSKAHNPGRDSFSTVNSWDETGISKVGYERTAEPETTLDFLDTFELRLRGTVADAQGHLPSFSPEERTNLSAVLPARNIIPNPEFEGVARVIPHWETSILEEHRRGRVNPDRTIILNQANEWLRTERIAIPQESTLHFSQSDTCNNVRVFLVDKDGDTIGDASNLQEIQTDTAAFAIVEFRGPNCRVRQPLLQIVDELGPSTYEQATKKITDLEDNEARSGTACCPSSYCWNGYACVEPMGQYTYMAEHIADGRDYRCIDGEWSYQPVKFDWNQENWGFCEDVSECFVQSKSREANSEHTAETFYQGQTPTCISDGEFILDNFCDEGMWSSRTKFIANKLLETAEDDFSLYCTDYREALLNTNNPGDKEQYLGGQLAQEVTAQQTLAGTLLGAAETEIQRTCFDTLDASLVKTEDNTCINNACVFLNDGKVAFGTSLNKPTSDPAGSFLFALNVPVDQLLETCPSGSGWQKCGIEDLDIEGDLWYNEELNAVVYGKQGIQLEPGLFSRITQQILDFFSRFIGGEAEAEEDFAAEKQFKEIYLLEKGNKKVRAVQEITAREKILLAEYENFDTPVCDFVRKLSLPADAQTPLLEQVSGRERVSCSAEDTIQKVEISESLGFFWPQLTGKLRIS